MSDSTATVSLAVDASKASAGAAQFKRAADDIINANKGVEAATIRQVEGMARQQKSVDALARRLDPLGQAVRDATRDMDRLTRISQGSGEAAARAATLLAAAQQRVTTAQQAQATSMRTAETASRSFADQTTQTTSALRQLGMQQSGVIGVFAAGGVFAVGMAAAAAAVTALGTALKAIPAAGDAALASTARLSATVGDMGRAGEIFEKLTESSRQTGISVTDSAAAFQRFSIAAKDIGATNDQVLNLVSGLQKFAQVSGASTSETAAATQQLAQALASGVLQGDELRSILENMPMFAQALAKELGTSIGNLRTMGAEGKLTAEVVFPAMMRAAQGVDDVFAGMPVTMAKAQAQFDVATQSFLTSLDQALGLSQKLVAVMQTAAGLVDSIRKLGGGATAVEREADLIAQQAEIQARISGIGANIDQRRAGGMPEGHAFLDRLRAQHEAAKAELQKNRDELSEINKQRVHQDEADFAIAQETRLAAQIAADTKSVAALKEKHDKGFAAEKAYNDGIAQLNRARNTGSVSEADYVKLSNILLKERDETLKKLNKTEEVSRTGVQKATDSLGAQIRAQKELAAAYGENDEAVRKILATQEAEKKAISDGLVPGTQAYASAVAGLTVRFEELAAAKGDASLKQQISETEQATESQRRITAAYDGTQESLDAVMAQEKAHTAALKAGILPGMQEYEETVSRLSQRFLDSTNASRDFQQAQSSVSAIMDTLGNAADRLGQGLVDAFLSGSGAAVNFGNIAKSILASVVTDVLKLGVLNPAINSIIGGSRPTLGSGIGALTGGGTSGGTLGGIMDLGSNLSTFGGISDALGLTDFAGQLSGIGEYLGLTGSNGLFGGLGGGIQGLLSTQIASGPPGSLAALGGAEFGGAAGLAAGAPITLGAVLSGLGLGFGAGSLAGGAVQSSLGKVGPAPQIGAGIGAGIGVAGAALAPATFGISAVLAGLLGGLVGGAGGGLIGPKAPSPFSSTAVNVSNGVLEVGGTVSQLVDVSGELARLSEQVAQLNQILGASGSRIANGTSQDQFGQNRLIGANSGVWLNIGQSGQFIQDLAQAFGELRFTSDDPLLNQNISNRSFAGIEELATVAQEALTFTQQTEPLLRKLADNSVSFGAGTLATTIETLTKQFDAGIAMASKLGYAEFDLVEARRVALQIANDNAAKQLEDVRQGLLGRFTAARGTNTGNLQMQLDAQLLTFDAQAKAQREALSNQLKSMFGDAYAATQGFAEQMAFLEATLGEERLATAKSFLDAMAAQQKQAAQVSDQARVQATQTAASIVVSISDYVRGIKFGAQSPIPASDRLASARSDFERTLASARGGDGNAIRNLTTAAETFRTEARASFGSGTEFVAATSRIMAGLEEFVGQSADALTNAIFATELRSQTQTLADALMDVRSEIAQMRQDMRQAASGPPAARAA